jgi:hypothetical protein
VRSFEDEQGAKIMRKPRPKLTAARYAERFAAEKVLQQRRYCDAFECWRSCGHKACRRERGCRGDANACLRAALATAPRALQWQTREAIMAATPATLGGPERRARQSMPVEFYDGSADRDVVAELKRLRNSRKLTRGGDNAHTLRLRLVDARRGTSRHADGEGDRQGVADRGVGDDLG